MAVNKDFLVKNGLDVGEDIKVDGTTVIDTSGEIVTAQLKDSGVTADTYGSAAQVPVITVDAKGRVTSASTTAVAGVSSVSYNTTTGVLTVSTSDGTDHQVDLSIGSGDSLVINGLTVNGTSTVGGHILPDTDITYDLGSATNRFRDLYLSSSTIYLGDIKLSKNATTGALDVLNTADDTPIDLGNNYNTSEVDGMVDDIIAQIEALTTV